MGPVRGAAKQQGAEDRLPPEVSGQTYFGILKQLSASIIMKSGQQKCW